MDNKYKYLKQEVNETQFELNILSDIPQSFFLPKSSPGNTRRRRSKDEDEPHNRTRRLFGAVAALAARTGLIIGEPINDSACNALSIFNLCDSTEDLKREVNQVTKQQKSQQQAFRTVQDQDNEKLALLPGEIRLTQGSVEESKNILIHTFLICLNVYTYLKMHFDAIKSKVPIAICCKHCNFTCHKLAHCTQTLKPFVPHFTLMEVFSPFSDHFLSDFRSFHLLQRDTLLNYNTLQWAQILLPTHLATIVQELATEEVRKGSKLTPALPSGLEAIYYELEIVLGSKMVPIGIFLSFVFRWTQNRLHIMSSKQNLCINPMMTAPRHPFTNSRNPTSRLQQTIPFFSS